MTALLRLKSQQQIIKTVTLKIERTNNDQTNNFTLGDENIYCQ